MSDLLDGHEPEPKLYSVEWVCPISGRMVIVGEPRDRWRLLDGDKKPLTRWVAMDTALSLCAKILRGDAIDPSSHVRLLVGFAALIMALHKSGPHVTVHDLRLTAIDEEAGS